MTRGVLTYIIGAPGVGKSTLLRHITSTREARTEFCHFWQTVYGSGLVTQLGRTLSGLRFPGTDTLHMAIQPKVVQYLAQFDNRVFIGEGDRLGNGKFFESVLELGYKLEIIHLSASPELLEERRRIRGTKQSATWLKGRETKVARLAERFAEYVTTIDASLPLEDQAAALSGSVGLAYFFIPKEK